MACSNSAKEKRKSHQISKHTGRRSSVPRRPGIRASAELIERTRKLMERTIDFVSDTEFDRTDILETLHAMRPETLDEPPEPTRAEPGLSFVTGFVQSPLLTLEEEKYLFAWMNFLKSRAERNRRLLDLSHPDASLVDRINADLDEALRVRNHIVRGNLRLVVSVARKISGSLEQLSDLIGEGMTPLIRSVELFDVGLGNRFSTVSVRSTTSCHWPYSGVVLFPIPVGGQSNVRRIASQSGQGIILAFASGSAEFIG